MTDVIIAICRSDEVQEGGAGVRFPVTAGGEDAVGFVVRYEGIVRGFLNRCAHVPMELDWNPGVFFESSGSYLMCSTHGALYTPSTGKCAGGPCHGASLRSIAIIEVDNQIFWQPDDYIRPAMA
ncbi:MAG: Rieske 2Fe-2S domain-containing protein [Oxalobacteraceae bacterium]